MKPVRWEIGPGAAVTFALAYFLDDSGWTAALVPAAAVHELGHALALRRCGARIRSVRLGVFGAEMDYAGALRRGELLLSLLAGPAAGLLYALAALRLGGDYFRLSAALSLGLTAFNLLPVLPLDGGRVLETLLGERTARRCSLVSALALLPAGAALLLLHRVPGPAVMACWLLYRSLSVARGGSARPRGE